MDVSDNKTDTERPNTTTSHEGDKEYDEYKKHDSDEEPRIGPPDERGPQKTPIRTASSGGANANTDSPQSSHSQKSVTSSNARSVPSTNPGTPSSDGSLYERYYVQPNALRIYRGDPDLRENLTEVSVGSTEHQEMRECVNIAMCILSRTRTRNVMATYSIGVVEHMESKHHWSTAGTLEVYGDGIPTAISKWLERLGRRFPDLYITPSMGPCYGYTQRFLWGDDIDGYPPQVAAEISIHSGPFDRMCRLKDRMAEYMRVYTQESLSKLDRLKDDLERAQENRDPKEIAAAELIFRQHDKTCRKMREFSKNYKIHYERSLFHLAVTLAHECFHVLTGYWTGFIEEFTPPKFFGEYLDEGRGEAGEWWEYKHGFNGSVDLVWNKHGKDKDDPYPLPVDDKNMSAGIPYLKQLRYEDDGSTGAEWTRISHAFIKDFIEKGRCNMFILFLDARC